MTSGCYLKTDEHKRKLSESLKGYHPVNEWRPGKFTPSGKEHPNWKGGFDRKQYNANHPKTIWVQKAEKVLGRSIKGTPEEIVHHINGDKSDNRNCNLLICSQSYHMWLHNKMSSLYMAEHFIRREK
jgi:hypothetical protein